MKSYTDISQSKKLAEILPLESADMMYHSVETEYGSGAFVATSKVITNGFKNDDFYIDDIPCWSLAALLDVIPKYIKGNVLRIDINEENFAIWYDEIGCGVSNDLPDITKESAIDACVEMVIKLHELNLL